MSSSFKYSVVKFRSTELRAQAKARRQEHFFYLFAHAQTKVTLARQSCFHWIIKDGVVNEIGKNENVLILPTPILSSL